MPVRNHEAQRKRLLRALQTVAIVIDAYGDKYWPIFEAVKHLLEQEELKQSELSIYLEAARTEAGRHSSGGSDSNVISFNQESVEA